MKKKFIILFSLICMVLFTSNVYATASISCDKKEVIIGDQITCKITTENDEEVKVTSSLTVVAGDTSLTKSGNIVYKAQAKGNFDIKAETTNWNDKVTIVVNEKPTSTSTTTTTTTTKAKSSNNYLSFIKVNKKEVENFDKETIKYELSYDNSIDKVAIEAKAEDDKAKVSLDGNNELKVGENEFTIKVTSEDGTDKLYKLIITREEEISANTKIKSIDIKGYSLKIDGPSKTYHLKVDKKTDKLDISVVLEDEKAGYEIEGNDNLVDGSTISIIVTAENNDTDTYRILISKDSDKKENKSILPLIIIGALLLIVVIVVIVVVKKKKNKKDNNDINNNDEKNDTDTLEETKEFEVVKEDSKEEKEIDYDNYDNDENEKTTIISYSNINSEFEKEDDE